MPLHGLMLACYNAVREHPRLSADDLARLIGVDARRTKNALHSLRRRGAIKRHFVAGEDPSVLRFEITPGWTEGKPPLRQGPQRSTYARGEQMSRGEWEALIVNYEVTQPGGGAAMYEQYRSSRIRRGGTPEISVYDFGRLMHEARRRRGMKGQA